MRVEEVKVVNETKLVNGDGDVFDIRNARVLVEEDELLSAVGLLQDKDGNEIGTFNYKVYDPTVVCAELDDLKQAVEEVQAFINKINECL